ncbi:hypothetical protein ERO13_A05G151400v2 [Gossypium hirsutum]|uniref:Uncharacterized protein isoform X1 n=2 Tax=Gossypium hirsutum TaxID=3635 RepID=A0A1U8NTS7_GOSHI|nr:uncharacterized protein LOC107951008 isoform X1 [Gossypium hirsutum]KAG4199508.1 hypothetical protein ERO13_A05G151400v2 [Gossypium hirsutum]
MGSSVMVDVPSSRNDQTAEKEGGDCDGLNIETCLLDLNQQCQGLGHEVSRLNRYNLENKDKLRSLKSRIEAFNQREVQLTREIEQLERKVLMSMLQKGFNDDELEKFGEVKEIKGCEVLKEKKLEQEFLDLVLEIGKINDKFKEIGIGIEETEKCEKTEDSKDLDSDLAGQLLNLSQRVSDKKESMEKLENMGNAVDNVEWSDGDPENEIKNGNVSDDGEEEEIGARELCKEIEILEAMLERGSFELLDLKTAMEEIEALKGSEKMTSEMEELESGLWELKRAIAELKGKKSKELKCWVTKEEGNLNWGSIIASVGAAVVAVAAMVFVRRATGVKFTAERGNKHRTG